MKAPRKTFDERNSDETVGSQSRGGGSTDDKNAPFAQAEETSGRLFFHGAFYRRVFERNFFVRRNDSFIDSFIQRMRQVKRRRVC